MPTTVEFTTLDRDDQFQLTTIQDEVCAKPDCDRVPNRQLSCEPDGRPGNLIALGGAGLLYLASAYVWTHGIILLIQPLLATVFALYGVAESLPATRRQTAFRLRILGVLLAGVSMVVGVVELLGGPQLLA
ncbi:MAG: hypothetical protein J07HX64_01015 [halophilic archaeon J07HX64]|jgi:hypothetical protein|nr:MAG: hypothetical protein J07HX64_01015 [halophilic archaeon J07HX64]